MKAFNHGAENENTKGKTGGENVENIFSLLFIWLERDKGQMDDGNLVRISFENQGNMNKAGELRKAFSKF